MAGKELGTDTERGGKFRQLSGFFKMANRVLLMAIPISGIIFVLDLHTKLQMPLFKEQFLCFYLGLTLAAVFLTVPSTPSGRGRLPFYDVLLSVLALGIGFFGVIAYPTFLDTGPLYAGPEYVILGIIEVLLVLEATRRTTGWVLVILAGVFILYALFHNMFPQPFYGEPIKVERLAVYLFLDTAGILGVPMWVAGSVIFAFILLGSFLSFTGGSKVFNDFSMATLARYRGGPAKVAIVGSSLFGMISGSAVANVAAVGVVTIPMMKKSGYSAVKAGAIEAVASTGGQLMPPVMGVAAFVVAELLAVPYSHVAIAAAVPAILYYMVLFMQVDLEAAKFNIRGVSVPVRLADVYKRLWIIVLPLAVLVYALFVLNYEAGLSGVLSVAVLYLFGFVSKDSRITMRKLVSALEDTGRGLLEVGAISASAGIIIGVLYVTGLGTVISYILLDVGKNSLFLMLLLTALVGIILGMGMPTTSVYIILAVLVAPTLVNMGIMPMAAHLFIFYFGVISMITPPVCLATFAAASIAGSPQVKTGILAVRFGLASFIIPFVFVYSPGLILKGSALDIFLAVVSTTAGLFFVSAGVVGYLFQNLKVLERLFFIIGGIGVLFPLTSESHIALWILNIGGLALCLAVALFVWRRAQVGKRIASDQPHVSGSDSA
jgi:TRAP transporter 4TM/12TM fusion protein